MGGGLDVCFNTTKDGGQIYLDIDNIDKPSTNIIRYWLKWIKKEGDYSVFLSEMDCAEEEYRMLQRTDYSKEGKVVRRIRNHQNGFLLIPIQSQIFSVENCVGSF